MNEKTIKEVFWEQLPIQMKRAHIKPVDLANALGLSKSTISCWLSRKSFPEMDNVQKMADVLSCTTDDLLGNDTQGLDVDFEKLLVAAYRAADEGTQAAVRKLLDIK